MWDREARGHLGPREEVVLTTPEGAKETRKPLVRCWAAARVDLPWPSVALAGRRAAALQRERTTEAVRSPRVVVVSAWRGAAKGSEGGEWSCQQDD
jgi:hypothetical protein